MKSRKDISRRQFVSGMLSSAAIACVPKSVLDASVIPAAEALQAQQRPRFGAYRIPILSEPFPMENVRLLDGPFLDATKTNLDFMRSLPEDRLVHNFRVNAGIPSSAEPLGGWEDPKVELRGHYTGHYLSACALAYASTGDEELKSRGDAIVADLA
ncbi:MAG TPA: beta-L-arabinofuranosidase domain-containing protein, partial [Candidatus Methylomirabilis sp.]|nr:beta-L-arabinofuranosidase domain-containing protein [Candidatus Methylomirabilis sp.]